VTCAKDSRSALTHTPCAHTHTHRVLTHTHTVCSHRVLTHTHRVLTHNTPCAHTQHTVCSRTNSQGNETWVLSATGAMRLDDYRRLNDTSHRAAETLTGTAISTLNPNDFLTIKEIARGGGGCVVKALHKPTMSLVAVKKMKISSAAKRNAMR